MTDRARSKDGTRDTDLVDGKPKAPSGQGRAGGRLAREVGTRDEQKRATHRPAGATRVQKSNKQKDQ